MLTRMREAGLVWPTLLTLAGFAILVALGNWQMRRLAWKETLIANVEARAKAEPISLAAALGIYTGSQVEDTADAVEFLRVAVKGRFRHDQEFHVWSPGKRGPAWSIVTPLVLPARADRSGTRYPLNVLLVIRGTVLGADKSPAGRSAGNPEADVEFVGRVRIGRIGAFSSTQNTAKNEWYEYDIEAMRKSVAAAFAEGSASGTADEAVATVVPFFVEAETPTGGPQGPQPDLGKVNLTNRHLEYVLTWYGLAATLLAVYLAFAWTRLRQRN